MDDLKRWITDKESDTNRELRPEDLDNPELHWLRHIQSQSFKREFQYLQGDRTCAAPIYVQQFRLFVDDKSLLRCQGRINNSDLAFFCISHKPSQYASQIVSHVRSNTSLVVLLMYH